MKNADTPTDIVPSPKNYLEQGKSLLEQGNIQEAISNFERVIKTDPDFAEAYRC